MRQAVHVKAYLQACNGNSSLGFGCDREHWAVTELKQTCKYLGRVRTCDDGHTRPKGGRAPSLSPIFFFFSSFFLSFFFFFFFFGNTRAAAASLHHSSWQHQIHNPLSEAREQTHILMDVGSIPGPTQWAKDPVLL